LELYSRKSAVGGGSAKAIAKILSTHPDLSKEDALNLRRRQIVNELCEIHVTQSGYKAPPVIRSAGLHAPMRNSLSTTRAGARKIAAHRRDRVRTQRQMGGYRKKVLER
jgi:hypothetical protein